MKDRKYKLQATRMANCPSKLAALNIAFNLYVLTRREKDRNNQTKKQEDSHVEEALWACGYLQWTLNKVRRQIESKRDKKTRKQCDSSQWPMVVIPYVENVSEAVARIMRKHNVPVAMKPYKTLKCTDTSKRQTGEGRLHRMCVQSYLCQL